MKKICASAFKTHYINKPDLCGQLAARKVLFGDYSRYAVAPIHTRFDAIEWLVWDAEHPWIDNGTPHVIRQSTTLEEAIYGLND